METIVHWLVEPFAYAFMQRALIEVILMGAVTGAIGTYVVLRGLSFIGDALSHAIFPGVVIAFLLGRSVFLGALAFGLLTSASIVVLATTRRVKEDSAIGVLFAGSFALGVVLISTTRNYSRDLASFLFGNVLGVTTDDIALSAAVGGLVLLLLVLLHKELLLVAFDREAAQAMGVPVFWVDLLLLVMISLTIVVSLSAVGNILVVAMLVTPAATARLLTDRLPMMLVLSAAHRGDVRRRRARGLLSRGRRGGRDDRPGGHGALRHRLASGSGLRVRRQPLRRAPTGGIHRVPDP